MSDHGHDAHGAGDHHHIVPIKVYLAIFATLAVMTGVTIAIAWVDLGAMNIFVALAIAVFKATLVVLYFMHVKYSSKLVQLASVTGFVWLGIMLAFTFSDYLTAGWQPLQGWTTLPVDAQAVEHGGGSHAAAAEEGGEH